MSARKQKLRFILPEAKAGSTGFRRFPIYSRSVRLDDIRRYLDPSHGYEPKEPDVDAWGGTQRTAIAKLDALAERLHDEGRLLPTSRMPRLDTAVEFALGIDKMDCTPATRLRVIVSRAFARADFVAGAIAQRYELLRLVEPCLAELRKAAARQNKFSWELIECGALLGSLIERGQDREPREYSLQTLAKFAAEDPGYLPELETRLADLLAELPAGGRTPEYPRFFFAWRLTEVACAATGIAPAYSDAIGAPKNSVKEILRLALAIVGLDGERSLDETLRKFNSESESLKRDGHYYKRTGLMDDLEWVPILGGDLHPSKYPIRKGFDRLSRIFPTEKPRSFFAESFPSEAYVRRLFGDALVGHEPPKSRKEAYQHILFEEGGWLTV